MTNPTDLAGFSMHVRLAIVTLAGLPIEERAERARTALVALIPGRDELAARWPDRGPVIVPVTDVARLLADLEVAAADALDAPVH